MVTSYQVTVNVFFILYLLKKLKDKYLISDFGETEALYKKYILNASRNSCSHVQILSNIKEHYTHVEDMLRVSIFITDRLSLDEEFLVSMVTNFYLK
jgi:hypothetical protein